tara:strand:- start:1294 stop:1677 length:384 start_codon:yes stop_codon:yes gene_type:complete
MKIVKNKDFEKDESLKRSDNPDSPLRYPMNVNWTETHEERISWLQYENYIMCEEYISAKLLYTLAKIRFQEKDNEQLIGLERYKAAKEAFKLWEEVNQTRDEYFDTYLEKTREAYGKYHVAGRDEDE